ncbi:MAG: DUF547 domain-containing protein, partial [Pseudomonadota bacterium]
NLVRYKAVTSDANAGLEQYLQMLQSIDPRELNKAEQFAYWVNFYNAATVRVILDEYPTRSILRTGKKFFAIGPWDDKVATVAQQKITLNDIEHRILRPIWNDHRIHFIVNCASIGCPNLSKQALTASNAEALLNQAAKDYLNHPRGFELKGDKLYLSTIFKWYAKDFGQTKLEMLETLGHYLTKPKQQTISDSSPKIKYRYDWSLNEQK